MSDIFITKLGDFFLNVTADGISDPIEDDIVENNFPFSKRNFLQNLGTGTRITSFDCIFMDPLPLIAGQNPSEGFLPTYDNHNTFLVLLDKGLELTFVHPTYGERQVRVKSRTINRTRLQDFVTISLTLFQSITNTNETTFKTVIDDSQTAWREASKKTEGDVTFAEQVATSTSAFQASSVTYINKLNSFFRDVSSPANSIVNTINYAEGTAGDVLFAVNSALDRIVESATALSSRPDFLKNIISSSRAMISSFVSNSFEAGIVAVMAPARVAVELAETFVADENDQQKYIDLFNIKTFNARGDYVGTPIDLSVMTINELEDTLQDFRDLANDAVQIDHSNFEIKQQAADLQVYTDEVKLKRDKIVDLVVVEPSSMYRLLLERKLSYQRAKQNLALNPNQRKSLFITGEVRLQVPSE